ncbi:TonB-dependent receptor [Methylomonas sp. EbA]|uniref:TonB-dependent receptor n=2 Tax=Methylomonas albis TaxID=1854563 RepID=A0ABR9CX17_9GAMM|nr:TonB-dependent receptor [Methylomonas albis]
MTGLVLATSLVAMPALAAETTGAERSYHISGGTLSHALSQFAGNAGIMLSADARLTDGKTSQGLDGEFTVEQGLQKLLVGTGLNYTVTAGDAVAIKVAEPGSDAASTLPAVNVIGNAAYDATDPYNPDYKLSNALTATKTDTPIMETPFSVQVVSKQVLQDRQAVTIDKALDYVSGVVQGGFNQQTSDGFMIRGFQTTNYYRDGVLMPISFALANTKRETANLESIEVLKGPGSLLYGRAEPGGLVNITTKQPLSTPYYSLQQQFGSYNFYRTSIDATGPISKDETLLYRANLSYENSGSLRDFVNANKVFFAPVVKWNISARTQASFELEYQHFNTVQDIGIPPIVNRPASVSRNLNLVKPFNNNWNGDSVLGSFGWSHEFNDNWKIVNKYMTQHIDIDNAHTSFVTFQPVLADGSLNIRTVSFPRQRNENYFSTLNLIGKIKHANITQDLLFGFDYFNVRNMADINNQPDALLHTNLFNPVYRNSTPIYDPANQFTFSQTQSWYGLYFQDQISLPYGVHVMGGLRYDNASMRDNVSGMDSPGEDRINPRGGILWQPVNWLSVYGSYTENFGVSNASYNADGHSLPPQTAQQWETGIKTEFLDGKLRSTLAYFDLKQQNLPMPVPGTFYYRALGSAETRGIEFDTTGEVLPGWNIIAAYTYMPYAKITKDLGLEYDDNGNPIGTNTGNQGNRLFAAPSNFGSLWNTYEIQSAELKGLKFGAGIVGVGQRQGNPENTYQVPGYVTVNLMASYQTKVGRSKVTTQLNADNILDKTYFVGTNSANQIQFGAPLTIMGSVRVEF